MSYAIVQTGGKQYRVEPGRFYDVELLGADVNENLTLSEVLLVNVDGNVTIGQPRVAGATVEVTVLRNLRAKKIIVYKMKPKKKTRKKNGHRQNLTRIMVNAIAYGDKTATIDAADAPVDAPVDAAPVDAAPVEVTV